MSYKTLRLIEFDLTPSGIRHAIAEIHSVRDQLYEAMQDLIKTLAEQGAEIAKMQVASMDAVDSGQLEGSIYGYFDSASGIGYVIAGAPHAFYVEYGTGPVGEANPHPLAGEANWQYDIGPTIHETKDGRRGWFYVKGSDGVFSAESGEFRWTAGQPSRPFMCNTMVWLEEAAEALGRTILS